MNSQWQKMNSNRVADLLASERIGEAAQELYDPDMRPDDLVFSLCEASFWVDAITVASCTLPAREAVWWACVCARNMESIANDEHEMAALQAAETWVYKPNEENRLQAFERLKQCDPGSAGSLAASAATFNDSKLPLVDGSEVDLDKTVFTNMVSGAVVLSAGDVPAEQIYLQMERFLESASDIANGGDGRMPEKETAS